MNEHLSRISGRCMMCEMRRVDDIAQVRISQRYLNVKDISMQHILQQSPDHYTCGKQPEQLTQTALRLDLRSKVKKEGCYQRKNPEGAKPIQPLFQRHVYILLYGLRTDRRVLSWRAANFDGGS